VRSVALSHGWFSSLVFSSPWILFGVLQLYTRTEWYDSYLPLPYKESSCPPFTTFARSLALKYARAFPSLFPHDAACDLAISNPFLSVSHSLYLCLASVIQPFSPADPAVARSFFSLAPRRPPLPRVISSEFRLPKFWPFLSLRPRSANALDLSFPFLPTKIALLAPQSFRFFLLSVGIHQILVSLVLVRPFCLPAHLTSV